MYLARQPSGMRQMWPRRGGAGRASDRCWPTCTGTTCAGAGAVAGFAGRGSAGSRPPPLADAPCTHASEPQLACPSPPAGRTVDKGAFQ
eukprot:312657-Chlamydomonas_euryale.AAC.1